MQSIKLKQNASSRCDFLLPDVPTVFFVKSSFEATRGVKNKSNRKDKLLTIIVDSSLDVNQQAQRMLTLWINIEGIVVGYGSYEVLSWAPVFSLHGDRYVVLGNKKIGISTSIFFRSMCLERMHWPFRLSILYQSEIYQSRDRSTHFHKDCITM